MSDQNTANEEIPTQIKVEEQEKKRLPIRSTTPSSSSSSEITPPSKSNNLKKEPLYVVRERIRLLIKKLDVRAWFRKMASHENARKASMKTEKPDLENDQKQTNGVEEVSRTAQEEKDGLSRSNEDNDIIVTVTSEACIERALEGLPWEVVLTEKVKKVLHGKRLESWKKKLFLEKVTNLAQGQDNWTLHLCKRLEGFPKSRGMLLYETRLTDAARIIWECALAFSPRYSDKDTKSKTTIYSEIIRIWDIVFDHDKLSHAIENIVTSFIRGQGCILKKELRGLPRGDASQNQGPNLYVKRTQDNSRASSPTPEVQEDQTRKDEADDDQVTFFPPASHHDNEYQVLKFYHLSTAMIQTILKQQSCNVEVDFPFRVTEEEHDIINFEPSPQSSIILIGRSGTGKTTCILYRLWKDFINYWTHAVNSGPLISKRMLFLPKDNSASDSSNLEGGHSARTTSQQSEETGSTTNSVETRGDDCEAATSCPVEPIENSDSDSSNLEGGHFAGTTSQQLDQTQSSCDSGVTHGYNCEAATNDHVKPVDNVETGSESKESLEHLHQLFITKNGVLCQEIKKNFNALNQACPFVEQKTEQDTAPLKLQEVDDSASGWPLFLNARSLYVILDASLPEPYFFPRNKDGSLETRVQDWGEEDNQLSTIPVIDDDEDADDEDAEDDTDEEDEEQHTEGDASTFERGRLIVFVSYSIFENQLWSEMCKTKKDVNFHPSLVWMEIRSFIKGSYEALHTESGHLSLETYQKIGKKRAPNFTADREAIYKMFLSYEKVKKFSNMFDENDLVFHLYHRLRQCRVPNWSIHNLYVDETQDFTQAELVLLMRCCRDPNGIFLTGDTAQSIMQGISFRFEDLRSLFFYLNENYKAIGVQAEVVVPQIKQLVYNYRSHSGILNLASSVVSILQEYFPESVDKLSKDQGQLVGPKPVLLGSCSESDLAIILRGNQRKTATIEFGAHQAILVKSNEARERLPDEMRHALVLTIYEAKGLEFDDVLVYNFFKDLQANIKSIWGVVTQYLLDVADCKTVNTSKIKSRPLAFDPDKHKILNSELKQLYTAVTRARAKVWFFDEDEENRRPVFEYFEQLGLAEIVTLETGNKKSSPGTLSLENMFPKESSLEEWEKQGTFFYNKKVWKAAETCFTKSGNVEMSQKCKAYVQAKYAESLQSEPRRQKDEFLRAADQFLQCNMIQETRACLINARERTLYASLLQKLGKERNAARVFERNGNFLEAGQCLEVIADYSEAVEVLLRGRLYSRAIEVLRRFNQLTPGEQKLTSPPSRTLDELYLASAEFHSKTGNKPKMNASLQNVKSLNARVDFLKKQRLFQDAAKELHKEGHSADAANVMRENGSFLFAADYARSSGNSSLTADCILAHVRSKTTIPKEEQDAHLEEAKKLYKETEEMNSLGEVTLRQAKLSKDQSKVLEAMRIFSESSVSNTCGELECVEFLFETAGDEITGLLNNWKLVVLVKKVIDLIFSLNVRDPNFVTQMEIDKCEEYFGLSKGEDVTKRVVRHKEGVRFLLISQELEKQPLAGSKWEMVLENVRARIGENLFQRIASLIPQIRSFLSKAISTNETCQRFLVGIPCDHRSCHCQHSLPSDKKTEALFWAISHTIFLDARANDFFKLERRHMAHRTVPGGAFKRQLSPSSKELNSPFPRDSFESCLKLLDFFFPPMGVSPTILLARYISRVRKTGFLKKSLYKFAETLWKTRSTREEHISDVNLFIRVSNLLQLIGSPPSTILSWIKEEEEEHFLNMHDSQTSMPRVAHSAGMVLEGNPPRWTLFARWWEDSKRMLHVQGNILDAGHNAVRRFLKMTASPGRGLPFPFPRNFLAILEYHMCVHLALAACVFSYRRPQFRVCLPRSYLSVVTFWDTLNCSLANHFRIYYAVQKFPRSRNTIRAVQKFLGDMVSIMLGGYSSKFNVLDNVLRSSSCSESGEAERAVILVLTMLCNCGQSFPTESERSLLRNLCVNVPDEVVLPQRIRSCLEQVRQATGIRQIVVILQNLLSKKQEELCDVHWKSSHGRLWRDEVDPSAYIETFNTDVLESLSQETPEISPEDVSESEAEEYGPRVEYEGLISDLDPERSEKLQAIEREEALQAKSWKEEMIPEESVSPQINSGKENTEDNVPMFHRNVKVDESGCGICNVIFTLKEQHVLDSFPEQANKSGSPEDFAKDRDSHLTKNSPHWKKQQQLENYKVLLRKEVLPSVSKVQILVEKAEDQLRMADQQNMSVSILSCTLNEVKTARSSLIEVTSRIEKECKWGDEISLMEATVSLTRAFEACQEEVRKQNARQTGVWSLESQSQIVKDGECVHVPGLKKNKK
ncbi:hypothetical protein ACROYT_G032063 [Oculina patagonica]